MLTDHQVIEHLQGNSEVFRAMLQGISVDEQRWRPSPEKWSLLEIVCHLCDEEREDFRARVMHALFTPEGEMPPIDPEGWVTSRRYSERDYNEMVGLFLSERSESIRQLKSLDPPNWESACIHPKYGPMSASFFLSNWLAHDLLHMRQILRVRYQYLENSTNNTLLYAGEW